MLRRPVIVGIGGRNKSEFALAHLIAWREHETAFARRRRSSVLDVDRAHPRPGRARACRRSPPPTCSPRRGGRHLSGGMILNRVRRLPKPTQASEAVQPIFEAVSNALHAVEDAYGDQYQARGRIIVNIKDLKSPDALDITVADNGIGLDGRRYDAFCTTDTDHKISRGGKGSGRLLWLDAFNSVSIDRHLR